MKPAYLVFTFILLFGSARAASSATADGKTGPQKPDWEAFHSELERAVELQVEATRREAEMRSKRPVQAVQASEAAAFHESKPNDLRDSPASLVDGSTLHWLSAALKRPIPDESSLRAIFREEGVPEELVYVGLVESGYSRDAFSTAGAVGPWQFIDETGRRYGLKRSKRGDDRRNLIKSTRAAARYLRDLHDLLGDWKLALAGYNAGENRVLRAMQKASTNDFWSLRHLLPQETADYVPRVLAAISIAESVRPEAMPETRTIEPARHN